MIETEIARAREMASGGMAEHEIAQAMNRPRSWVKDATWALKWLRRPGVSAALADFCAGMSRQEAHVKHGQRAFNTAFKLWMQGERL